MSYRFSISRLDAGQQLAEAQERDHVRRLTEARRQAVRLRIVQSSLLVLTVLLATVATVIAIFLFAGLLVHLLHYAITDGTSELPPPIRREFVAPFLWSAGLCTVIAPIRRTVIRRLDGLRTAMDADEAHPDRP